MITRNEKLPIFFIRIGILLLFILSVWSGIRFQLSFATSQEDEIYQIIVAIVFSIFEMTMLFISYSAYKRGNIGITAFTGFLAVCLLVFSLHTFVGVYAETNQKFENNGQITANQHEQIKMLDAEIAGYEKSANEIEMAANSYSSNQKTARLNGLKEAAIYREKIAYAMARKSTLLSQQITEGDVENSKTHSGFQSISRVFVGNISLAKLYQSYWGVFWGSLCVLMVVSIPVIVNWITSTKQESENVSYETFSATVSDKREPEGWKDRWEDFYSRQKHRPFFGNSNTENTNTVSAKLNTETYSRVSEDDLKPFLHRGHAEILETPAEKPINLTKPVKTTGYKFVETDDLPVSETSVCFQTETPKTKTETVKQVKTGNRNGKSETSLAGFEDLKTAIETGSFFKNQNTETVGVRNVMRFMNCGYGKAVKYINALENENINLDRIK